MYLVISPGRNTVRVQVPPFAPNARVVESADTSDSKSDDGNIVWVQAPPFARLQIEYLHVV